MTGKAEMDHALNMRDELVKAIRAERDPSYSGNTKINPVHARVLAESLIREGLVDLDELSRRALREPDDEDTLDE